MAAPASIPGFERGESSARLQLRTSTSAFLANIRFVALYGDSFIEGK